MNQLTKEQAIALYKGGEWRDWTDEEVVKVQLYQTRLCLPFDRFHAAIETVLGRSVWTHEFVGSDALRQEYEGIRPAPTMEEIIALLPHDKIFVIPS